MYARNLAVGTTAVEEAARFSSAVEAAEAAHQSAELQYQRRQLVPITVEAERAGQLVALTRAQIELDAILHDREQRLRDLERQQQLEPLQWQKVALALQTEITEARAQHDAIRRSAEETEARHRRQQEIAYADHRTEMLRRDLMHFEMLAQFRDRLAAVRQPQNPPMDDGTPEEFRRHFATEARARANLSEAEVRIAAIYDRARTERRNLTPDEIEEVDALTDSGEAAAADIRRRAASGLG